MSIKPPESQQHYWYLVQKQFSEKKFILESQMEMDFDSASYSERARKPSVWRFFVEVSESLEDGRDYNIYFVGFNELKDAVCVWEYANKVAVATSTDDTKRDLYDECD